VIALRRSPLPLCGVLISIGLATATGAAAQTPPVALLASPPPAEATEIAVVGSPANLDWVRGLMRSGGGGALPVHWSRMDRFDPRDVLRSTTGGGGAIRCWIDLTEARHARIYFAARSRERFLIRDLDLSGAFDELDRATLAEVLDLSLLALAEDERAGLSRAETETLLARRTAATDALAATAKAASVTAPVAAPAIEPPASPVSSGPRVGVFYAGQGFSTELPIVQGPGLLLSWAPRPPGRSQRQVAAWLSVQYQIPADDREGLVGLRLQTVAPRAGVQIRLPPGLDARLGLGAALSHLTPLAGTAGGAATLTTPRWSSSFLVTAAVGATVPLTRRVEVAALLFADYLPSAVDYDLLTMAGQTTPVVSSFRLRPGIALELTVR
jgi:hypothetical protein